MTEHTFFPPLAEKPDYMDDVKDMDNGDGVEIYSGVYASKNIADMMNGIIRRELQAAEPVKPLVRQVLKQVAHDSYKARAAMEQAANIFDALMYGDVEADYLEPNNKRLQVLCDGLLDDEPDDLHRLFLAAMEYGYKLAEQQTGAKKAVE